MVALSKLDDAVLHFRSAMLDVFPEVCNVPNFIQGRYYRDAVKNYGVAALLSVCMEEMLHGLPKQQVPSTYVHMCAEDGLRVTPVHVSCA